MVKYIFLIFLHAGAISFNSFYLLVLRKITNLVTKTTIFPPCNVIQCNTMLDEAQMVKPPEPTSHHNSRKCSILLPLSAIYFRLLYYETPCSQTSAVAFFSNFGLCGHSRPLPAGQAWTFGC